MIQSSYNAISSGATGMFGKQVVKYFRHGKEIIAKAPPKRPGKGTPGQERTRADFSKAINFSAKVRASNDLTAHYKPSVRDGRNIHNLAIADFLVAPEIHDVHIADGTVMVHATDNFQVHAVKIMVYDANGALLESGLAGRGDDDRWIYRPVTIAQGGRVEVVAVDLPGNECRYELTTPATGTPEHRSTSIRIAGRQNVRSICNMANTG
ncbi:hypothetical protein MKQ68_10765 [Chitinophaga horti]|uniref:Uncharacterized protein n=1 Tax=Chitinophaga horti TaxID=2920382 RepID=A0ABY6J7B4_9BACT|nr:hypothetical protein [Chitinophaga horti]UYQ95583.1 hypothetical protein MKQ68_10765 [Chitinophaga horti]